MSEEDVITKMRGMGADMLLGSAMVGMRRELGNEAVDNALELFGDGESRPSDEVILDHATWSTFRPVNRELARARAKFPSSVLALPALMEEVGELTDAMFIEADAQVPEDQQAVQDEAVQVAVMALRCREEGDPAIANNEGFLNEQEYQEYLGLLQQMSILGVECKDFIGRVIERRKAEGL